MSRYCVNVWTTAGAFRGHGRFNSTSAAMAAAQLRFGDVILGMVAKPVPA